MRLTTKGRFAVTAMIDVALHGRHGPVNLASISQRQQVSLSHLELLFAKLRRHELVESTRGPGGGYSLGRQPDAITVADIVLAIDDAPAEKAEPATPAIPGAVNRSATDELWASVNLRAVEFLDSISLKSLVDDQIAKGVRAETRRTERRAPASTPTAQRTVPPVNAPNSVFALGALLTAPRRRHRA